MDDIQRVQTHNSNLRSNGKASGYEIWVERPKICVVFKGWGESRIRERELIKEGWERSERCGVEGFSSEQQRASGMTRRLEGGTVPCRRPDGVRLHSNKGIVVT